MTQASNIAIYPTAGDLVWPVVPVEVWQ